MELWLLSFRGEGAAVIVKAESLTHARLVAVANDLCRPSLFDEGYAVDPELVTLIPKDYIGRNLSRAEARDLLNLLSSSTSTSGLVPEQSEISVRELAD
jgi:hypothetical protein